MPAHSPISSRSLMLGRVKSIQSLEKRVRVTQKFTGIHGIWHSLIIIREALILTLSIFIVLYFLVFTVLATGMIPNDMIYRDHIIQYTPQGVYYCPRDNISRAETMTNGNYNAERMAVHCPVSGCNGKFTPLGP